MQQIEYHRSQQRVVGKLGGGNKKQGPGSIGDEILAADEAFCGLSYDKGKIRKRILEYSSNYVNKTGRAWCARAKQPGGGGKSEN